MQEKRNSIAKSLELRRYLLCPEVLLLMLFIMSWYILVDVIYCAFVEVIYSVHRVTRLNFNPSMDK